MDRVGVWHREPKLMLGVEAPDDGRGDNGRYVYLQVVADEH